MDESHLEISVGDSAHRPYEILSGETFAILTVGMAVVGFTFANYYHFKHPYAEQTEMRPMLQCQAPNMEDIMITTPNKILQEQIKTYFGCIQENDE